MNDEFERIMLKAETALGWIMIDKIKQNEYGNLVDYIAAHHAELQGFFGDILNDPNFFKHPAKVQEKIEKFLHDKKFDKEFKEIIK